MTHRCFGFRYRVFQKMTGTIGLISVILTFAIYGLKMGAAPNLALGSSTVVSGEGSLIALDEQGRPKEACPLEHADVKIQVSGFLARTMVTQHFKNPFSEKIEAVYVFPLPHRAAVDDMTLTVGKRIVKGKIKRREEAQAVYEAARSRGHVAGLLDQERPNLFTQSVANIMPGEEVTVTIQYVESLEYADGSYELVFPMVVGPRYIPGSPTGKTGDGWAHDTDQVPDASRITPRVTPPGTRAGHDLSLVVDIDSGVPLRAVHSPTHDLIVARRSPSRASISLKQMKTIPNKDFILRYTVGGGEIEDALLTDWNQRGGFFTLILQPPRRVDASAVTPKELVFVLDTSGSMSGFPIEKAKETMELALAGLHPRDSFNLITFAGDTHVLFPEPVPASSENLRRAQAFLRSRRGGGGTEMMKAIRAALAPSDSREHVRIVCFMTDGYVGNDMAIIAEVQKHPNARVFSFGVGSSVNRFLLDQMALHGRGEVEYVGLDDDGSAAARRFHERVRNPLLTDISVDWGHLEVEAVYPRRIPDLFSARALILTGRYTTPAQGTISLSGQMAGRPFSKQINVNLPDSQGPHRVLSTLWARKKIADLMRRDLHGLQRGVVAETLKDSITQLGLDYNLVTQFTSFVAVEEMTITAGGKPRRIDVPVEMPAGLSYELFGRLEPERFLGLRSGGPMRHNRGSAVNLFVPQEAVTLRASRRSRKDRFESKERDLKDEATKLDARVFSLVSRLKKDSFQALPEDARFVREGKAEIRLWLVDTSEETLEILKQAAFELLLDPGDGTVIGRIAQEKLEALSKLPQVRYVAPVVGAA